jgi:hypothetical protein
MATLMAAVGLPDGDCTVAIHRDFSPGGRVQHKDTGALGTVQALRPEGFDDRNVSVVWDFSRHGAVEVSKVDLNLLKL